MVVGPPTGGTAFDWGRNHLGQLGIDNTTNQPTPVPVNDPPGATVASLDEVTKIAAGGQHTAALRADGTVFTWGDNSAGQLGDGTTTNRDEPVKVVDPDDPSGFLQCVIDIEAGGLRTYFIKGDCGEEVETANGGGTLWVVGNNDSGQLGLGFTSTTGCECVKTPEQISSLGDDVIKVSAGGFHNLAITTGAGPSATSRKRSDGETGPKKKSGGAKPKGQSGDGGKEKGKSDEPEGSKEGPSSSSGDKKKAGDGRGPRAAQAGTQLWAWGRGAEGQLGINSTSNQTSPVQVKGPGGAGFLTDVIAIGAGGKHSLAVKDDGTAWGWGRNAEGQVGDGTTKTRKTPVQVKGEGGVGFLTDVLGVAAGDSHSLALKGAGGALGAARTGGVVRAWGKNSDGQLGDGSNTRRKTPVAVSGLTDVLEIAAGGFYSLARTSAAETAKAKPRARGRPGTSEAGGEAWSWGSDQYGQLGNNASLANSNVPVMVTGLSGVLDISAGYWHAAAVAEEPEASTRSRRRPRDAPKDDKGKQDKADSSENFR